MARVQDNLSLLGGVTGGGSGGVRQRSQRGGSVRKRGQRGASVRQRSQRGASVRQRGQVAPFAHQESWGHRVDPVGGGVARVVDNLSLLGGIASGGGGGGVRQRGSGVQGGGGGGVRQRGSGVQGGGEQRRALLTLLHLLGLGRLDGSQVLGGGRLHLRREVDRCGRHAGLDGRHAGVNGRHGQRVARHLEAFDAGGVLHRDHLALGVDVVVAAGHVAISVAHGRLALGGLLVAVGGLAEFVLGPVPARVRVRRRSGSIRRSSVGRSSVRRSSVRQRSRERCAVAVAGVAAVAVAGVSAVAEAAEGGGGSHGETDDQEAQHAGAGPDQLGTGRAVCPC